MHISLTVFAKQNITVVSKSPLSTAAWNDQRISAERCCLLDKIGRSLWSLPLLDNLWKIILSHNGSIQTADVKMRGFSDAHARKNVCDDVRNWSVLPSSLHVFAEKPPWNWTFNSDTVTDWGNSRITHWHSPCQNINKIGIVCNIRMFTDNKKNLNGK